MFWRQDSSNKNPTIDKKSNITTELYTTKELLKDLSSIKIEEPKEKIEKNYPLLNITVVERSSLLRVVKEKELPKVELSKEELPKRDIASSKSIESKRDLIKRKEEGVSDVATKPKLAIIIDDISNAKQIEEIKALKMKITPSIFPPSRLSMVSHKLAIGLKHYMIHLPMESSSRQFNRQYKTLITDQTKEQIEERVQEIRRLFPTARYVNNHTGSVFTSNYKAMKRLYKALRKEGFTFIDSRTIGSTKVKKIAHEFGDIYIARDIFLDNKQRVKAIHKQLKKAVKIAKKRGYSIAIGHPHKVTMEALAKAGDILKEVKLVYIDEIVRGIR